MVEILKAVVYMEDGETHNIAVGYTALQLVSRLEKGEWLISESGNTIISSRYITHLEIYDD